MEQNINIRRHGLIITSLFIVTAITPGFLLSGIVVLLTVYWKVFNDFDQTWSGMIFLAIALFFFAFVIALIHVLVFGVPLFFIGLRLKKINWRTTIFCSFLVGGIPWNLILFQYEPLPELSYFSIMSILAGIVSMGFFGMSGGIAFWLLWRYWILEKSPNTFDTND